MLGLVDLGQQIVKICSSPSAVKLLADIGMTCWYQAAKFMSISTLVELCNGLESIVLTPNRI
ncbi:MAG: hypothetical protein COA42_09240 [Alteromonadaceae bacterium]|nr:MAG: hypothetical protein COA42_09240 [Alteromonadaceae bacterium]